MPALLENAAFALTPGRRKGFNLGLARYSRPKGLPPRRHSRSGLLPFGIARRSGDPEKRGPRRLVLNFPNAAPYRGRMGKESAALTKPVMSPRRGGRSSPPCSGTPFERCFSVRPRKKRLAWRHRLFRALSAQCEATRFLRRASGSVGPSGCPRGWQPCEAPSKKQPARSQVTGVSGDPLLSPWAESHRPRAAENRATVGPRTKTAPDNGRRHAAPSGQIARRR